MSATAKNKYQVFISHTKHDKDFCDKFDVACARVGIKAYRSEFEKIKTPAWSSIKAEILKSSALFLLVGKKLVEFQNASLLDTKLRREWSHTQNWIAYEVGLACQRGIDVWVICDDVEINFPVPYFNNYALGLSRGASQIDVLRFLLESYANGERFLVGTLKYQGRKGGAIAKCQDKDCQIEFNLHNLIEKGGKIICPQCLKRIEFPEGHLLQIKQPST